jgi:ABC-type multidrug transport system fused ATPase/permease subunit
VSLFLTNHCGYVCVGVISQETFLFTGTIRDNIDIHGQYSDEDVLFVLNSCGILQTFCQMKASVVGQSTSSPVLFDEKFTTTNSNLDGVLDITLVDANLSQGQKQLLAVARILLTKPQFVLLDEASSSLDPLSEARMYGVLQQYLPITTTLLAVNHRYERSIIQELCPQVLELSQGKVVRYDDAVNLSSEV